MKATITYLNGKIAVYPFVETQGYPENDVFLMALIFENGGFHKIERENTQSVIIENL